MHTIHRWLTAIAWALVLMTCPLYAAKFNRVLEVGEAAPAWKELPGADGKPHSLDDLGDSKAVVVVFTRNHCPIAKAYEPRLVSFAAGCAKQGVAFVAINVSQLPGEDLRQMGALARQRGWKFPYLRDGSQKIGEAYGATVTPQVFLLDAERKIAYMGAFDDHPQAEKVTEHYARDALTALLAGKAIEIEETLAKGCDIRYASE